MERCSSAAYKQGHLESDICRVPCRSDQFPRAVEWFPAGFLVLEKAVGRLRSNRGKFVNDIPDGLQPIHGVHWSDPTVDV